MRTQMWGQNPEENGKKIFREHNQRVRDTAKSRGRDILEYEVKQGWAPLCEFLEREIPVGVEYPRSDDWASYKKEHASETSS